MSQYPSPYQPPQSQYPMNYGGPPTDDALGPARRAGGLMFVMAGLIWIFRPRG